MLKKILFINLIFLFSQICTDVPKIDELSDREITKIKSGFVMSYFVNNIEAIKTFNKNENNFKRSLNAEILIILGSLIITFQRERDKDKKPIDWHYIQDAPKLIKNGICTSAGALLGIVFPTIIELPFYIKKYLG